MAVVDADIIIYGAAVMPDDDVATQIGGAIDLTRRVVFVDVDPDGRIEMVSDNAGDTMNVTATYIKDDGTVTSETVALTGVVVATFADTIKTILKIVIASAATGSVTIQEFGAGDPIFIFNPGELEMRRVFYNALAEESGGAIKTYYDKFFIKNTNAADVLTSAQVVMLLDPIGVMSFALETVLEGTTDNGVGNNRQVAPSAFTFDSTTKNVANSGNLSSLGSQGVWVRLTLGAGTPATESSFTLRLAGVAT